MKVILRIIGRLILAFLFFQSSFEKISSPSSFLISFSSSYSSIQGTFYFFPSIIELAKYASLTQYIQFLGILEAIVGFFVALGDSIGGFLIIIYVLVEAIDKFVPTIIVSIRKQRAELLYNLSAQFFVWIMNFGLGLILMKEHKNIKAKKEKSS